MCVSPVRQGGTSFTSVLEVTSYKYMNPNRTHMFSFPVGGTGACDGSGGLRYLVRLRPRAHEYGTPTTRCKAAGKQRQREVKKGVAGILRGEGLNVIKLDMLNRHAYIHKCAGTQMRPFLSLCLTHGYTQKSNEEEQGPQGLLLGRSVIASPAPSPFLFLSRCSLPHCTLAGYRGIKFWEPQSRARCSRTTMESPNH